MLGAVVLASGLVSATASGAATLITDASSLSPTAIVETFESFTTSTATPLTSGIMTVEGVRNDNIGIAVVSKQPSSTSSGTNAIGTTAGVDRYTFSFSQGISQFLTHLYGHQFSKNVDPNIDWTTMSLYDASDSLIQSFNLDAITGGFGNQLFGFTSDEANVRKVEFVFAQNRNDAVWIDDVSYVTGVIAPVPLPAALPALLTGLGLLAAFRRRRGAGRAIQPS